MERKISSRRKTSIVRRAALGVGMKRWLIAGLVLAGGLPALSGCLFAPRTPEAPASGEQITYLPPRDAANVLANAETALNFLDVSGYEDAISEDFTYIADSETVNDWPGVDWENWGREQELAFINAFFTSGSTVEVDLRDTDITTDDISGTEGEWEVIYFLKETATDGSEIGYRGRMLVGFKLETSFVFITRWEDLEGQDDPDTGAALTTLGRLRGAFASK